MILFTVTLVSLLSCGPRDTHLPKPPISKDTFARILYELHYADAAYNAINNNKDSIWRLTWSNYKFIYQKHHITYTDFKKTFQYYCYHSKELDDIYAKMLDSLSIQQAQLEKK